MRNGNLTRDQAIAIVGIDAVNTVDHENCDYTNRVQTDGDDGIEFSASVACADGAVLIAYYYLTQNDIDNAGDDLSNCDWQIAGYEIV